MMRVISSLLDKLRGRQAPPCLLVGLRMEKGDVIIVDILNLMSENDNTTLHPGKMMPAFAEGRLSSSAYRIGRIAQIL